jgi:hypothetical protein
MHRAAFVNYAHLAAAGRAGLALEASMHNADPPILDLVLKIAGLPKNAKPPSGELKNVEQSYAFSHLRRVLNNVTGHEAEQARRDWLMLAGWVAIAGTVDWNVVTPDLEPKIRSLLGAPPDPPSWQARKAQRQRPLPPPPLIQVLLSFWKEFPARAAVLPFLIDLRRSPALDQIITTGAAMVQLQFERFPRRAAPATKDLAPVSTFSSPGGAP